MAHEDSVSGRRPARTRSTFEAASTRDSYVGSGATTTGAATTGAATTGAATGARTGGRLARRVALLFQTLSLRGAVWSRAVLVAAAAGAALNGTSSAAARAVTVSERSTMRVLTRARLVPCVSTTATGDLTPAGVDATSAADRYPGDRLRRC